MARSTHKAFIRRLLGTIRDEDEKTLLEWIQEKYPYADGIRRVREALMTGEVFVPQGTKDEEPL